MLRFVSNLYSVIIFDFAGFLALLYLSLFGYKNIYKFIKKRITYFSHEKKQLQTFSIFLYQYFLITILVWTGFYVGWNKIIKNDSTYMIKILGATLAINIAICVIFSCYFESNKDKLIWVIYLLLFIPIMTIYCFSCSYLIEEKYILCFLFIVFFDLLSITLFIFFTKSDFFVFIFIVCLISNIITIIPFHFFWIKNAKSILIISILAVVFDIYLMYISYFTKKLFPFHYIISTIFFDYGFFFLFIVDLFYH